MSWFRSNDESPLDTASDVQLPSLEVNTNSSNIVKEKLCKYYANGGCKAGTECRFSHEARTAYIESQTEAKTLILPSGLKVTIRKNVPAAVTGLATLPESSEKVATSQTLQKSPIQRPPVQRPKVQTTMGKELDQLKKRFPSFRLVESTDALQIIGLQLPPSDPDFPFDLDHLTVRLLIPSIYPAGAPSLQVLEPASIPIKLRENVQDAYDRMMKASVKSKENVTLVASMNWLDKHLEELLIEKPTQSIVTTMIRGTDHPAPRPILSNQPILPDEIHSNQEEVPSSPRHADGSGRPGLFEQVEAAEDLSEEEVQQDVSTDTHADVNNGTQIRLVGLIVHGVALLQPSSLQITLHCTRCRTPRHIESLLPDGNIKWMACATCKTVGGVRLRPGMCHQSSTTIATLDLENLIPYDFQPSTYSPTCENCNSVNQGAFRQLERDREDVAFCRQCHAKMTIKLGDVKFVQIGSSSLNAVPDKDEMSNLKAGLLRKMKSKKDAADLLGIVPGQPLPKKGRCQHYGKSFRWFRFPCCQMIYPCDVCHEQQKTDNHDSKWANKQICGFCSRESAWSSRGHCDKCGSDLTKPQSKGGFWEGGKGVRDVNKMSSKDSHKYRGLNKTVSRKQEAQKK
jgi:hypothetical protein